MEKIEQEIACEYLRDLILNDINIKEKRKSSIYKCKNPDIAMEIIDRRLSYLTKNNKTKTRLTYGKSFYFIKDQRILKKKQSKKMFMNNHFQSQ